MKPDYIPGYVSLHNSGELKHRGEELWNLMQNCELCPRICRASRLGGDKGECGADDLLKVASYNPHFGEEAPLVGSKGSGTIFLSHCSLKCLFCQNYDISHQGNGRPTTIGELAAMMLKLQNNGCHNINIVTPTHYAAHVVMALERAAADGLTIPLVYNTSSWERIEVLEILFGIVDIYLADLKFMDNEKSRLYTVNAEDYPDYAQKALTEMHKQVRNAKVDKDGLVRRGLMIRHLVMPNDVSGSAEAMQWIAENLSTETYVNIMAQYRPSYMAFRYSEINRPVSYKEYVAVVEAAQKAGLTNLDIQGAC